ncbi:MAG: aminotransferase class V-fold PLP-dependent enzyme [Planctomycetales bacterium]|nr:aminotransferase class V-fold PLP-dependent enzyme [Planctomycetales bacterium]
MRVHPFRAIAYDTRKVPDLSAVVTQPYDKISPALQDAYHARSPWNWVRIVLGRAEPGDGPERNVYTRARDAADAWLREGVLVRRETPAIYATTVDYAAPGGRRLRRLGFVALADLVEYGVALRPHEKTLAGPKADRLNLLRAVRGHFESIFFLYADPQGTAARALAAATARPPDLAARDDDGCEHRVWAVSDPLAVAALQGAVSAGPVVIADGHHRYETALNYSREIGRREVGGAKGTVIETPDRVLGTFVPLSDPGLTILATHRTVRGVVPERLEALPARVAPPFQVAELPGSPRDPAPALDALARLASEGRRGTVMVRAGDKKARLLALPAGADPASLVPGPRASAWKRLDVTVLHGLLLEPHLGIGAAVLEKGETVGYHRDPAEALAAVSGGKAQAAFLLNPTRIEEVEACSAAGETMPQKSTDFYPKLLSGLVAVKFDQPASTPAPKEVPMAESHKRLFIPGPIEVSPEIREAMATPVMSHRSTDFRTLYGRLIPKLKTLLSTKGRVFVFTSSGTGAMEAAIRNCVRKRVLSTVCGAFSQRWHEIALACGKEADKLEVEWGKAVKPEAVEAALKKGSYDAITVVHNESSTGLMNPLPEIAAVVRKFPDVLLLVDTVSSMAGVPLSVDAWGLDVCLASSQKAFAVPPGIAVVAVSDRTLARAKEVPGRGLYFDFLEFAASDEKQETPNTPSTQHFVALDRQMDRILAEGLENRWARHRKIAEQCRAWARKRFSLFPEAGYESVTLSCIRNDTKLETEKLIKTLAQTRKVQIANGYGKLKDKTFRIAHMGDTTEKELGEILGWLDEIVSKG